MPYDPKVIPIMRDRLVLVAEPDAVARMLLTSMVRDLGYPAEACSSGTDVLTFLTRHPLGVQCVLIDLALPDLDGGEVIERALELVPRISVILMVGPHLLNAMQMLTGGRQWPWVPKPVRQDALATILEEELGPPRRPRPRPSIRWPWKRRRSGSHRS
jgi:CheY-like chemotaxis protein